MCDYGLLSFSDPILSRIYALGTDPEAERHAVGQW